MNRLNYNFVISILSVVATLCGSYQVANGYCYEKDFKALKIFYESTNGDDWINNAGWEIVKNNDIPPAQCNLANLKGVTIWAGRVIRLQLAKNNLTGQIPSSLYFLDKLQILDLSSNALSGKIPIKIGYCLNLTNVNLKDNSLENRIPFSFSFLKNLSHLNLNNNNLTGRIPAQISSCKNLIRVELSGNELSSEIPIEIGQLQKLTTFDVSKNQLSGYIPAELGNCEKLRYCFLNDNNLIGSIPQEVGNIENLRKFFVRNNDLEGCYPNNLRKICETLDTYSNTDYAISEGNNFYATWEKFDQYFSGACETIVKALNENDGLINVYPNPSKGFVNISVLQDEVSVDSQTEIAIFNTMGSKVYSYTLNETILKDINLNVGDLPKANYLLMLNSSNKVYYEKLVIN